MMSNSAHVAEHNQRKKLELVGYTYKELNSKEHNPMTTTIIPQGKLILKLTCIEPT